MRQSPVQSSWAAVLAGRDEQRPTALRPGAMVFPLDRRVARRSAMVGLEVAVTAGLADLLPTPPTAVVVVPPEVVFDEVVDEVRHVACGLLELDRQDDPVLTVGVACPYPVSPGTAGELCLYNLHLTALNEALVESVAEGRRADLITRRGNCVLLVQLFAAPRASAVVYASPNRTEPVRISGRWGLTEASLPDVPSDAFEVAPDGHRVRERLAWKPTANVTAHGGTRTVDLSLRCSYRSSLSRSSVLRLAALARNAADESGFSLSLDVAVFHEVPAVLRCRPCC
jgi:hypothetical protein